MPIEANIYTTIFPFWCNTMKNPFSVFLFMSADMDSHLQKELSQFGPPEAQLEISI
jgi:hypothetical protein